MNEGFRIATGIGGLIAIGMGALILFFPGKSAAITLTLVAAMVAAYALVAGVTYLGLAFFSRALTGWSRIGRIVLGLVYFAAGVLMVSNLQASAVSLAAFLTITLGVVWVFEAVLTFTLISYGESKAWGIIYGVMGLLAGFALILLPLTGAITLWLLVGVSMLILGVTQVLRAFNTSRNTSNV